MPFHASSLAIVQSTRMRSTSPACTHGRGSPSACAARIFWVSVIGRLRVIEVSGCQIPRACANASAHLVEPPHEADDALLDRHLGKIVKLFFGAAHVGERERDVARLVGAAIEDRALAER